MRAVEEAGPAAAPSDRHSLQRRGAGDGLGQGVKGAPVFPVQRDRAEVYGVAGQVAAGHGAGPTLRDQRGLAIAGAEALDHSEGLDRSGALDHAHQVGMHTGQAGQVARGEEALCLPQCGVSRGAVGEQRLGQRAQRAAWVRITDGEHGDRTIKPRLMVRGG
ncbi:unannotated protein [freshwater metagenome]|uniref:Unannotated protein n=1 Tax=freshwater metagenome TaxID=449393 RepID=A0A6J6ETJ1_9ZZZZ